MFLYVNIIPFIYYVLIWKHLDLLYDPSMDNDQV